MRMTAENETFFKLSVAGGGKTCSSRPAGAGLWTVSSCSPRWLAFPVIPTKSTSPRVTTCHPGGQPAAAPARAALPHPRALPSPTLPGAPGANSDGCSPGKWKGALVPSPWQSGRLPATVAMRNVFTEVLCKQEPGRPGISGGRPCADLHLYPGCTNRLCLCSVPAFCSSRLLSLKCC